MMSQSKKRINKLELAINLLEDHLQKYEHLIKPRPLRFIKGQIRYYKRELQIRRDFPI
ncbi:MAG: hypothetical protein ACFE96_11910 [Candidatus Hermodarchaeota archaeon]